MGQHVSRTDFEWTYTEEPHASRRKLILEKYPQIKKLFGCDPQFKWVASAMVLTQLAMLFVIDTDLPTYLEAKLFCTTLGKFFWVCLQPLFYIFRPLVVNPKPPQKLELVNGVIQLAFNTIVVQYFGWKVMVYLIVGSLLAMGLHPVAGHFISEHYMFAKGFETYSYYGPLNWITFNVGYHNEHHDFPAVPGRLLPEVKRIAPEFYDNIPQHTSWTRVLYDFITDPSVGPYARIKRKARGLDS
ncbi:AGAP012111-PA [Anopheles gambiae str. PEST]|uniref:AGAP012111-PA n=1 Tax=Anopheles gambiae TaxID=7165 RepID=Q7PZV8_ANOGA|nr:AGAP012111-PA [Anopheles gambiae str. PEST]